MSKLRSRRAQFLVAAFVLSSCIGCDRATKALATQTLRNVPPQTLLNDTIRLEYALNPGGFLGLGSNLPGRWRTWIFVGANSCLILGVCAYLATRNNIRLGLYVAMLCVVAGGLGNLIDRVWNNGLVTDFINLGIGPVRTGIFNVADIAVTFGGLAAVLLLQRQSGGEVTAEGKRA